MKNDSLGDRMKEYENVTRTYLTRRLPVILRLDGKAFHSFTKGFEKPFDMILMESMWETTQFLCKMLRELTELEETNFVYNGRNAKCRKLADWWDKHKKADKKRQEKDLNEKRRIILQKLTDKEIKILGLRGV